MNNDFELLYLIQCHYDRGAKEILFKKYKPLIYKLVLNYIFDKSLIKDYIQISLLKLEKAYLSYHTENKKTFTRYFELILKRDIFKYVKKTYKESKNIVIEENLLDIYNTNNTNYYSFLEEEKVYKFEKDIDFKSKILNNIYKIIYLQNKTIKQATQLLNMEKKQIYNALYRIKTILKDKL